MAVRRISVLAIVLSLGLVSAGCAARSGPHAQDVARIQGTGRGLGPGQICGGVAGLQCRGGLYCAYPPRSCHADDAEGSCTAKPVACPQVSEPICGCDGKTYENTCVAAQQGVSPISDGVCSDHKKWSWFGG